MTKLKSSLTCTMVSLLMVFFFAAAVQGGHPWTEEDPCPGKSDSGDPPPRPGPDSDARADSLLNSGRNNSTFGLYSSIVFEVSARMVDFVYGTDATVTKVGTATGNDSNRK